MSPTYGTSGRTSSTILSAQSMARFWPHETHNPRLLHENGTIRSHFSSHPELEHLKRRNPKCGTPQRMKASRRSFTLGCMGPYLERNLSS